MAVLVRTRRVVNPGKRKLIRRKQLLTPQGKYKRLMSRLRAGRSKNPAKKRMTLKQKLHFGTARQRAAARLSLRGRKTNPTRRKNGGIYSFRKKKKQIKISGGSPFKRSRKRIGPKRRKNVGEIVSISLAGLNPGRKRRKNTGMAKRRRRATAHRVTRRRRRRVVANPAPRRRRSYRRRSAVGHRRRRRSNPGKVYAMRRINRGRRVSRRRSHRRGNPGFGGVTTGLVSKALAVIGGAIGSKYVTQLALGGNNTGYMGYAGNLVASIALGWATTKVTKSKDLGQMVLVGGIAGLSLRILQDMTSIGQYVNLSLSGAGKGGDLGLGIIQDSSFPVPQTFAPGSMTNAIVPRATRSYVSAQTAQMAVASTGKSGMGRMMGRPSRRSIM